HDFIENERLDNARDLLIIGLRTGLRVGDFLKLKDSNFDSNFIKITTNKTNSFVTIPLHPQVKAILKKRGGMPRLISDQKFNKYIKEICKEVNFTQLVYGAKINKETKRKEEG